MSSYPRMKRLFPWKPHARKGQPPSPLTTSGVPQHNGTPGWLLLTHDEDQQPIALFVDMQERCTSIPLVMDERMFSDTVLRAIRLSPTTMIVCDIRWLNGRNVHETLSYSARKTLLEGILDEFHVPDLTCLYLPEEAPHGTPLRGYEYYDEQPGSIGVFLPVNE